MSMGDEVVGVTLQIVQKGIMTSMDMAAKLLDTIAKLLRELSAAKKAPKAVTGKDEKDLKAGSVKYRDLKHYAQKTGDSLSLSENGISKEDMKQIAKRAKKYGISVSFLKPKNKENIFACVRNSDLPIFKKICTEVIKEKIATKPQELGNFKCEKWQIPFLTAEMKNFDVPAMFPQSANGSFCLYDKKDERLVKLARNAFIQKAEELKKEISFDRDEEGFYTIKDLRSGRELSFDPNHLPTERRLARQLQSEFGFDENKANMCAAKFGEDMLKGEERKHFFSNSAMDNFSEVRSNVQLEGEDARCKLYQCWYLRPQEDANAQVVFRDDESGKFATLDISKMSRAQMREILSATLEINDEETLNALVEKAERVNNFYARQNERLLSASKTFSEKEWKDEQLIEYSYMENGEKTTKKQPPVNSVNQSIERSGNRFTVECTFLSTVLDENGNESQKETERTMNLSLTDKKKSIHELTEMYKKQGIPASAAKEMAKEAFRKAEMQSPYKVVEIEEVRAESMSIAYGEMTAEIPITSRETAVSEMIELGIPTAEAETAAAKAAEIHQEAAQETAAAIETAQPVTEHEPPLSESEEFEEVPEAPSVEESVASVKQEGTKPLTFNPPETSPEERAKRFEMRVAALSKVAGISPEDAEKALKNADMKKSLTSGMAELNVNLIGERGLANVNAFVESLGESLGISREETIATIKNANMEFDRIEKDGLGAATTAKTVGIGGNGHESHITETQSALTEAAKGIKLPENGIPEPPTPHIPRRK